MVRTLCSRNFPHSSQSDHNHKRRRVHEKQDSYHINTAMHEPTNVDEKEFILNHVILPRFLPKENADYTQHSRFMKLIVENVLETPTIMPCKTVELLSHLKRIHCDSVSNLNQVLSNKMNSLLSGAMGTFAMFFHHQNCTLLIHKQAQKLILATFSSDIEPSKDHLGDTECHFPSNAIEVECSELLKSEPFINQLCFFYKNSLPENHDPDYITKWLVTVLAGANSKFASDFPIITKKVRQEFIGASPYKCFRRSRVYLTAKVLLQHSLAMELDADVGKFLYKILMLKFLIRVCAPYTHQRCKTFNIDLLSQMMAKMARRIEKLNSTQPRDAVSDEIRSFKDDTINKSKQVIATIREKINIQIKEIYENDKNYVRFEPGFDFKSAVQHEIPALQKYFNQRKSDEQYVGSECQVQSYDRYFTDDWPTELTVTKIISKAGGLEKRIFWNDFENRVLYSNENYQSAKLLRSWTLKYLKYAEQMYVDNQLSTSRMILVYLKLIGILDQKLCEENSLLQHYQSGINPKIIDALLLPQRIDLEIASKLQKYFRGRNEKASYLSLVEEKHISEESFSVKFAEQNDEMMTIRRQIQELDEQNVDKKHLEWKRGRQRVSQLREHLNSLPPCSTPNRVKRRNGCVCDNCRKMREIENIEIDVYEHLLPDKDHEQWAIVFELKIPLEIAYLRDILYGFSKMFGTNSESYCIRSQDWVKRTEFCEFKIHNPNQIVRLGTTIHFHPKRMHVDQPLEAFVVENVSNCIFHADQKPMPQPIDDKAIKKVCAPFKTEDEYSVLQWTLNGTTHTENEVLARQSECPENLPLSEFKNFGTLRADGHRLQLRKLCAMIETQALSFEKESVLSLIMQTLWECGVEGDTAIIRESHNDLLNEEFCSAMLERLKAYTEQHKNNCMHPFKLLMVVVITVRLFEINCESTSQIKRMIRLFDKLRAIVFDWIDKIEKTIQETPDGEGERQLRLKLIYVAIGGCLTFFVHSKHKNFESIMGNNGSNGKTASQQWLHFIVTLKSNMEVYARDEAKLPTNLLMFLRLIERIGIDLESTMKHLILQDTTHIPELIKRRWPRSDGGQFLSVDFHPNFPELLTIDTIVKDINETQKVTIDIITGLFLVEGLPLCHLPSDILETEVYQRFFGDMAFEVQPDNKRRFSTTKKYSGCVYEFKKMSGEIIIIERDDKGFERELIHYVKLNGYFPNLLITNYSHWWNKQENCIEFRKRVSGPRQFPNERIIDYRFDLNSHKLTHSKTERLLLDINSRCFKKLVNQLERLEHRNFMNVLLLEQKNVVTIEMLRMKLKFKVVFSDVATAEEEFKLESDEFSGMHVSCEQNIGTLYGLKYGLLLESSTEQSATVQTKILLIPNGKVCVKGQQHFSVDIDFKGGVQNPPFYKYEVDEFCQQIKSSDCSSHASWFYLAHLHAVASHGEIEPFLGMSGTERALQILQSAFAWSSAPYKPDALKILKEIEKLSPTHKMTKHILNSTWPRFPTCLAQDSFIIIVKRLIENSRRLHGPHLKKSENNVRLNERAYWRHLQLQPNMRIGDDFIEPKELRTEVPQTVDTEFSKNTQTVSVLYHMNKFQTPEEHDFLNQFLIHDRKTLTGLQSNYAETVLKLLGHEQCNDFADIWINLYNVARTKRCSDEEFALVLSLLAHENEELDPILALQAISQNSAKFQDIEPPKIDEYTISDGIYSAEKAKSILQKHFSREQNLKKTQKIRIVREMMGKIEAIWPGSTVEFDRMPKHSKSYDYLAANLAINKKLASWYARYQLDTFIENVQNRLKTLNSFRSLVVPEYDAFVTPAPKNWPKFDIDVNRKIGDSLCDEQFSTLIKNADEIWTMKRNGLEHSAKEWFDQIQRVLQPTESMHLIQANYFPRLVPSLLLPKIIAEHTDVRLRALIGAWGMAISNEQRKKRIELYSHQLDQQPAMKLELENEPHKNWKPCERPEWLLFEIEQNLTIREIQIKVAEQMMNPPKQSEDDAKHSVMQLNMGEGKTSVIIPMLAAVLANGNQVCQITVLKALFTTNLNSLRQYLGGMLNQRMYTFPCRRDMAITKHIEQIQESLEECKMKKGVILTQPDYLLSFHLKLYESIRKVDANTSKQYLRTYQWINENVRNILDESDAILQPNFQLIYTVGNQMPPAGGVQRWEVTQALLKRVPLHLIRLHLKWRAEHNMALDAAPVEFNDKHIENRHVFTPCRILDDGIFDSLKSALADDFLNRKLNIDFPEVDDERKNQLKTILIGGDIKNKPSFEILRDFSLNEQNKIWIMSGLLRFEVLKLALTKRWRVNYGVDPNGQRKMAIPFKAKDVPAEMSEFGHPDVAICLTQLSYYYSGLTDAELYQLFATLGSKKNAHSIYESWFQANAVSMSIHHTDQSIFTYSSVNLDDPHQRDHILFPLLRHNMNAIDFWLANNVYPHEAKVFEKKLMCTAWDLCSDQLEHCVTGFSGTNDTKNILPLPIVQNDLRELEETNEKMRQTLLNNNQDLRNQPYDSLPPNVSGMYIVHKLAQQKIPVLLDSGALMLELANKQVAIEWLKLMPESIYVAAVYFDSNDILQTIDRNGTVTAFDSTVYRDNLSRCVVYLDDVHTRGTDMKFPLNWVACVTLSGDITRDKTVQSCMRMRQLGTNHSICFWASYEADIRLRKVCQLTNDDRVTNEHVFEFICHNSRQFEISNMVHWTAAAFNYMKKFAAHMQFGSAFDQESMLKLYEACVDEEFIELSEMYGDKEQAPLTDIAYMKFSTIEFEYKNIREIRDFVRKMQDRVHDKLREQAPNVKLFSRALNEEQQKELEHQQEKEAEEERVFERSLVKKAAKPVLNEKLISIVSNGVTDADINEMKFNGSLYSIPGSLSDTQLHRFCRNNEDAWAWNLFVSKDFKTVIEGESKKHDEYLRPVMWIARIKYSDSGYVLILLSSHECNHLLPVFSSEQSTSTLMMYRPRLSQFHSNLIHDVRLHVNGATQSFNVISTNEEAQIGMYAGSMYFESPAEQTAYCGFLGFIPEPLSQKFQKKYGSVIKKGFVPMDYRDSSQVVSDLVGQCRFKESPVDFAIKLIEARHQSLQKDSHVASILERGRKVVIDQNDIKMEDTDDDDDFQMEIEN